MDNNRFESEVLSSLEEINSRLGMIEDRLESMEKKLNILSTIAIENIERELHNLKVNPGYNQVRIADLEERVGVLKENPY